MKDIKLIIQDLRKAGLRLSLAGNNIRIDSSGKELGDDVLSLLRANKNEIIAYLKKNVNGNSFNHIPHALVQDGYSLSSSQRRLWILSQFDEGNSAYNIPRTYVFEGSLNFSVLKLAFEEVIRRHEILRTVFREDEQGEVKQFIQSPEEHGFEISFFDLRNETANEEIVGKAVREAIAETFNLITGPLLRATLYQVADEKYVFSYVMHHIISDGWSMGILIKEVMQLYNAFSSGMASPLRSLKIQYKDYAAWQQQQLSGKLLEEHRAYWLQQFGGEIPVLELNGDKTRPAVKTYNGAIVEKSISKEVAGILQELCNKQGSTLFMGLLAAVNTLLYRYTGQQDIVIGTPIAGREHADLEDQIGFYVNTLALRTRFNAAEGFLSLLEQVKHTTLGAYRHQAYPFDELVEALQPERDLSRNALFDVMLSLNKTVTGARKDEQLGSLQVSAYGGSETVQTKFDLVFNFAEAGEELLLTLEYNTDIYNASTAGQLAEHLVQLLEVAVKSPAEPIELIDYLSEEEKRRLLVTFNETEVAYQKDKTILDLFYLQVNANPGAIALVYENITVSYKELDERSNQLATYLQSKYNLKPNDLAGILLERSEWMIIAILAVLKSGAAYVPIDTEYPQERIDYMIADSHCKVLIDQAELNRFIEVKDEYSSADINPVSKPTDLAYVIYTSGSTGRPKGVMIEHGSIHARIQYFIRSYDLNESDRSLFYRSYSFDGSIEEYLLPILSGACMVIAPAGFRNDVLNNIIDYTERFGITKINMPPVVLGELVQQADEITLNKLSSLKHVVSGGDKLTVKIVNDYLEKFTASLYNTYGPTENTIDSTSWKAGKISVAQVPIGKPVENSQGYILDHKLQPVPTGVSGELYVSGAGLARGYLNNESLTKEKFIAHPFRKGEKMYRTGDRGRWLEDGNIEFLGRIDEQVKIRGFRIEPGEIENAIASFENMEACVVVVAKAVHQSEKELVAYVVSKSPLNVSELRSHLAGKLPSFMVPSYFVQLEQLPLTSNGKTDKKKLPDPENIGIENTEAYVAPRNSTEEKLAAIWQEVLGKERVSVKDNFFELGGHSLKATRLGSRIHKTFEVKLSLTELFSAAILEDQARLIAAAVKTSFSDISQVPEQSSYALSSSQRRLWVLSQFEAGNVAYNMPGVYVFEGELDRQALEDVFATLIERHEILRTVFKEDELGEVKQFILSPAQSSFNIAYHDFRNDPNKDERVRKSVEQSIRKPFSLSKGPLLRATLYHLADEKYVFCYVMHHIITDGWSMSILLKELIWLYNSFTKGEANPLTPLRIQYKDYAAWQQQQLSGSKLEEHKSYWLQQLEGELPVLELLGDNPRPVIKTYNGAVVEQKISTETAKVIQELSRERESTVFMCLLTAVNALLYRYTGQQDIIIGTPIAGREHANLEDQIGFYVNTLALRSRFNGNDSFASLLDHVKQITLGAYEHQVYPFDELVDVLQPKRDPSRNPLFDVMIILQNAGNRNSIPSIHNTTVQRYERNGSLVSRFDLVFNFVETGEDILLSLEYNKDIYSKETAEQLAQHLVRLLEAGSKSPSTSVENLDFLNKEEKHRLLYEFNNTATGYSKEKTLVNLFEEQAARMPDHTALVFENTSISFRELNERANQLCAYLRNQYKIQPGDLACILLDRNEWMIISILAVLKSGAGYVPIDPSYPQERIDYMLADSNCKVLINQDELKCFMQVQDQYSNHNPSPVATPTDLAYVIYTSGSTGKPKGCLLEHRGVVNRIEWMWSHYNFTSNDVILQKTNFTFDVSVWEIFMPLCKGATMVLCRKEDAGSPARITSIIEKQNITCLHFVPGMFNAFINSLFEDIHVKSRLKTLRRIITSGEALLPETVRNWYSIMETPVHNLYGPTEASVDVTWYATSKHDVKIPIGKPIWNTRMYIMRSPGQLLPVGAVGEICIAGDGLARGYLNKPAITSEKFVADPFCQGEGMYRTGDLGRWLADGNIEFIGRKDEQVKIRGYRIELGEIENALQSCAGIDSCAVIARTPGNIEKELIAYVVSDVSINANELRLHLAKTLPAYMVPAYFVQLDELPLTSSGKTDRKKLPDPGGRSISSGIEHTAPSTATEEKLVKIWSSILGHEMISTNESFFNIGGNSLKIIRMAQLVNREFSASLTIEQFFEYVTISDIARLLEKEGLVQEEAIVEEKPIELITF